MAKAKSTTKRKSKPAVQADWYLKVNGACGQTNIPEPQLGDILEFTVVGEVTKVEESKRGDGETRAAISLAAADAWPAGTERPATQPLMFDRTGEATDTATGADERTPEEVDASADEGDELAAKRREDQAAANPAFSSADGAGYSDDDTINPETGEPWDYPAGEPATDDDGNPIRDGGAE